jgi:hypothetical protein
MENKQTAEKLTAMEHLINWIDSDCTPMDCVMKAKELLQMEKEQIEMAFAKSYLIGLAEVNYDDVNKASEQYYNENYGKI